MKASASALIWATMVATGLNGCSESPSAKIKEGLLRTLKDPESAQFRSEKLYLHPELKDLALCGEVNAKNAFGGYTGFHRFIAWHDGSVIEPPHVSSDDFAQAELATFQELWKKLCSNG